MYVAIIFSDNNCMKSSYIDFHSFNIIIIVFVCDHSMPILSTVVQFVPLLL